MDQELKQRLIGASVIIALAIIFVPMLFDGDIEQKGQKNISISIPDEPETQLEVKKFELDKPVSEPVELPQNDVELVVSNEQPRLIDKDAANAVTTTEEVDPPASDPTPQTTTVATRPTVTETQPIPTEAVKQDPPKPEPVKPTVTETKPTPTNTAPGQLAQAYRVKLGSFSQQANAEKVKSSLLQKNIKAIVEYNPGLKLYRVWSQELYQTPAKANQYVAAVNQLKLNIGTPKVVTLDATEVGQMASQGQMGWVVQLGSFSAKNNAIELRNKVKAAGFSGFVDVITNSQGNQLYRLRIGPLMEKADAERTQADIKSRLQLDGLVKNHELGRIVN